MNTLSTASLRVDVVDASLGSDRGPVRCAPSELAIVLALAIRGRSADRDALADALYPDADPFDARNALKVGVHRARKRIGSADAIRYERRRYALASWVVVDLPWKAALPAVSAGVSLLEAERERLALLYGRLAGGRPGYVQGWEWFAGTERRLRELERDVAMILARDAVRREDVDYASQLVEEMFRADPLDEGATEIRMALYAQAGDRSGLAAYYRHYEKRAQADAGRAPSAELRRMFTTVIELPNAPP